MLGASRCPGAQGRCCSVLWDPRCCLQHSEGCVCACVCVCVSLLSFLLPSCVTMGKLLNVSVPVSSFVVRVSSDNTCALLNGAPGR